MAPRKWLSHDLQKVPSPLLPRQAGFIVGMFVEHASPVDRERQSARETSLDVAIAERLALYAATRTENEKSRNGGDCLFEAPYLWRLIRRNSGRQLASLSAKVQAYEDVIRKLSNRFGVSDEQLVNIALAVVSMLARLEPSSPSEMK